MTRRDYIDDPDAPAANSLVPAASAVVRDSQDRILLVRRSDNGLWTVPGGAMEPGESIADAAVRETREESGLDVEVRRLTGIYSNPRHVVAYSDGEVRQEFSVCFECAVVGGALSASDETTDARFFSDTETKDLPMTPAIRQRVADAQLGQDRAIVR